MKVYKVLLQTDEETCRALGGEYNKIEGLCYISGKIVKQLIIKLKDAELIIKKEVMKK